MNAVIRARLDDLMVRQCTILIGDATGADKAVQQYFAEKKYPRVEVFCMQECRNNVGGWRVRNVTPPIDRKGFFCYAAKDLAMSQEAKCGVMLWDGKSKGTLQNILNLVRAGKRTLVYFAPVRDFFVLATDHDLQELLARCDRRRLETALRGLGLEASYNQLSCDLHIRD